MPAVVNSAMPHISKTGNVRELTALEATLVWGVEKSGSTPFLERAILGYVLHSSSGVLGESKFQFSSMIQYKLSS
jgi:hypothetical protein